MKIMIDENLKKSLEECIQNGVILNGKVISFEYDEYKNTEVLLIDLSDIKAVIPREEFDLKDNGKNLKHQLGRKVKYIITEIGENDVVYCSRKKVKEFERERLIQEMQENGNVYRAKITHIEKFGAYLSIRGVSVTLKNTDFAEDYTAVGDIMKRGDKINVRLLKITDNKKILVEAVEKYKNPIKINFDDFYEGMKLQGKIKAIKNWGCYISIAPNLDVLAPNPDEDIWIDVGNYVRLEIKKIDKENQKIRGKVLRVLEDDEIIK